MLVFREEVRVHRVSKSVSITTAFQLQESCTWAYDMIWGPTSLRFTFTAPTISHAQISRLAFQIRKCVYNPNTEIKSEWKMTSYNLCPIQCHENEGYLYRRHKVSYPLEFLTQPYWVLFGQGSALTLSRETIYDVYITVRYHIYYVLGCPKKTYWMHRIVTYFIMF